MNVFFLNTELEKLYCEHAPFFRTGKNLRKILNSPWQWSDVKQLHGIAWQKNCAAIKTESSVLINTGTCARYTVEWKIGCRTSTPCVPAVYLCTLSVYLSSISLFIIYIQIGKKYLEEYATKHSRCYQYISLVAQNNFFLPYHDACGILVLWPGIEPVPPAVETWSFNHWTTREVPQNNF